MNLEYMGKLFLSVLIFAPGLILLIVGVFIGLLMMLEKWGAIGSSKKTTTAQAEADAVANPPPGKIVEELRKSLQSEEEESEVSSDQTGT